VVSNRRHVLPYAVALMVALGSPAFAQTTPTYGYVFTPSAPATGTPQILKVELNSSDLRAGGPIAIRVTTSPDVVKVVTGNGKHQGTLTQAGPGVFTSESTLPHIGGPLSIAIKLHFVATTADGKATSVDVPVKYK